MLLTISAPVPGEDLGYLLHKNPSRVHSFNLPFGKAHVFYPELGLSSSKVALLLDIDPIGLVRGRAQRDGEAALYQYVNDRPYVASSFMSVALSNVFGTAMRGRSKERQELAEQQMPFSAVIAALSCRSGVEFFHQLFEPLGYKVQAQHHPLDEKFPEWGSGPYYTILLRGNVRLQDLLNHIYILIPVLDAEKHYWVGEDEINKLLRKGEGWLAGHPQKELIVQRYLKYDRRLTRDALARLIDDSGSDPETKEIEHLQEELAVEAPMKLWEQRIGAVLAILRSAGAKSVVDLGCGEGNLLKPLLGDSQFERLLGMDVSWRSLEIARRRLHFDHLPPAQRQKIDLIHGSLLYRDQRLSGFDAAIVVEVIEHLDPPRLAAFERVVFEYAQPRTVVITTPNAEYNTLFPTLPAGKFRHKDHRFEWTRQEFSNWSAAIQNRFGYQTRFLPVGDEHESVGAPTQMGVFTR